MDRNEVRHHLRDAITGLVTPFNDSLSVDHDALAANAHAIAEQGIDTLFACSNVSEYHSLSHEERIAVTETSVNALPANACVMAGVGGSTKAARELGAKFEDVGVDVLLVMPPHHTYKHERGLLSYYGRIGEAVDIPLVPYIRGFDPSVGFLADLTELESVIGIKWTLEDLPTFSAAVEAGSDDVVWINGLGELHAIALYYEGAEGMASGIGNFEPRIGRALFDALERDDTGLARRIRDATSPYMRFRHEPGEGNTLPVGNSIPAVKAGMEFAGLTGGRVREPLVELSDREYERARDLYEDLESFIDDTL
ncbi:4-hydroxy-tetrahydrodipicolinate synthase [Halogeometricum rufum]|uniref:4-hydroxy-tetrahydrodipicolinate synthase n=1 Tax=Halogeometricum rufum TaxID=553469 RepID=A0A1I6IFJ8_9EURY|nr:dihydrodipicolinate synthase family protein [Halogeometricum rufum]SFR65478.1 4-hydroxy-tetrahydrodipicolinate synthase [Halogeometricum rufum]